MKKKKGSIKEDVLITAGFLGGGNLLCFLLEQFSPLQTYAPLVFVLAVLFVARFTDGYLYGIAASVIAVLCVNYVYTYPYFHFNFNMTGYPITFATMLAVSCMVSALTTQIQKQEKMKLEMEKEKFRANILRGVSHDIRTPLTSISGAASGILENYYDLDDQNRLDLVRNIRDDAQWLIRTVENLLSVTRLGNSEAPLELEEELVEEVISAALVKFEKNYSDTEIQVELPEEVLMIPMQGILIEQVLVNVMENAVVHGKTTTRIIIRVTKEDGRVVFAVEDNGQGINKAILPRMFSGDLAPEEGQESDSKRNMGIGLSVCMSIVKAHKGEMKAENMDNGGAKISFWLPEE